MVFRMEFDAFQKEYKDLYPRFVVSIIAFVVVTNNLSPELAIHFATTSSERFIASSKFEIVRPVAKIVTSSVKTIRVDIYILFIFPGIFICSSSLYKTFHKIGPISDPCGTLLVTDYRLPNLT